MRKKRKAPETQEAIKILVEKLAKFVSKGIDPNEALKDSITNGWKGIFEPRINQKSNPESDDKFAPGFGKQGERKSLGYDKQQNYINR